MMQQVGRCSPDTTILIPDEGSAVDMNEWALLLRWFAVSGRAVVGLLRRGEGR